VALTQVVLSHWERRIFLEENFFFLISKKNFIKKNSPSILGVYKELPKNLETTMIYQFRNGINREKPQGINPLIQSLKKQQFKVYNRSFTILKMGLSIV
jgi:hypothetical protein